MKTLLILVGVQGSGKTSVLRGVNEVLVLKPSTQRAPRSATDDEYYFEKSWQANRFAWTIKRGTVNYGMRKSELEKIERIGITVFDPAHLHELAASNIPNEFDVITIGLDTITNLAEQQARVGNNPNRSINQNDFDKQRDVIKSCNVVLSGTEATVVSATNEIIKIIGGRGGVISGDSIKRLIEAGTLLENTDPKRVEVASYDLRLLDKYWCQGKYHSLDQNKPEMVIPPYSFALVTAMEQAIIPSFLVGSFDIRVKLFISGVILSNGPQVDPGYRGALLCMLYNASGSEVCLNRFEHFATLQFQTTATNSKGYTAQYQGKKTFEDFIDARISTGPGGRIHEDMKNIETSTKSEIKEFKNTWFTAMALLFAIVAILVGLAFPIIDKSGQSVEKANEATAKAEAAIAKLEKEIAETKKPSIPQTPDNSPKSDNKK